MAALVALAILLLTTTLSGCGRGTEVSPIEPAAPSRDVNNPDLGSPAVDPLSFGPGDKGSPSWSPSGEAVAFIVDGYVSERSLASGSYTRRTTRDLGAERVTWLASGEDLAILGESTNPNPDDEDADTHPLYVTRGGEVQLEVESLADNALAMTAPTDHDPLVVALKSGEYESEISTVRPDTGELEAYPEPIDGRVTELSVTPDAERVFATVVASSDSGPEQYEIHELDLESGESERLARLPRGQEIFGAPQQTDNGVYYVVGERGDGVSANGEGEVRYTLYRLSGDSSSPGPASVVGRDFIASSIKASPNGGRLALLGRRDSASATNLYVLDLSDGSLYAATTNENMEIKTDVDGLEWSPDGESVTIVAHNDLAEPRVYNGSADTLLAPFYNLYEIPVNDLREAG